MSVDTVLDTSAELNQDLSLARGDIDALFAGIVGTTVESSSEAPHEPSDVERVLGAVVSVEAHTRFSNKKNEGRPRSSTEEVRSPEVSNIATLPEIMRLTATAVLAERLAATEDQFAIAA
jgi:hypothetical protein